MRCRNCHLRMRFSKFLGAFPEVCARCGVQQTEPAPLRSDMAGASDATLTPDTAGKGSRWVMVAGCALAIPLVGFVSAWVVLIAVWFGLWRGPARAEHTPVLAQHASEEERRSAELAHERRRRFDGIVLCARLGALGPLGALLAASFIALLTQIGRPTSASDSHCGDSGLAIFPLIGCVAAAGATLIGPWVMFYHMCAYFAL
jgi:hypothetical protein